MAAVSDTLTTVLQVEGLGAWSNAFGQMQSILDSLDIKMKGTAKRMVIGSAAAGAGALLLAGGLGKSLDLAAKMQQTKTGFTTLLGSPDAADKMLNDIKSLAARTPFSFSDAATGAQQLLGAGLSTDKIIPVQEALGKVLTANGKGTEDYAEALRQVSQIVSSGKIQGDELNILSERGLPKGQIQKLLQGKKGAQDFVEALIQLGNSGQYSKAFANSSNNLAIAWGNLKDASEQLGVSIGTHLLPAATAVTKWVTDALNWFNRLPEGVKGAVAWIGVGMVGALTAVSIWLAIAAYRTGKLVQENLNLANSYYKAAAAAKTAGPALAGGGGAGGAAASAAGGFFGKMKGFGGKALGFLGKFGLPAILATEGIEGLMEGSATGDWGGALKRALLGDAIGGDLKPKGSPQAKAGNPVLDELKKQTELQKQQLAAMEDGGAGVPTDFIPLGIQRSITKRFARAAR